MIAIHKETFGLYCVDLIIGWEGVRTDVFFFFFWAKHSWRKPQANLIFRKARRGQDDGNDKSRKP